MSVKFEKFLISSKGFDDVIDITSKVQNIVSLFDIENAIANIFSLSSCTSLITMDSEPNLAYDLFLGLADDMKKTGMIEYDGKKGVIIPKEELLKHKNVSEVFFNLRNKLSDEQVAKIAKSIDVMANLTPEQEEFAKSLNDKLQYSKNGKIAYVELSPDDEQWRKLGGDNNITSAILNNFRRKTLKNDKNLEVVMTFYEANGNYRFSAHAKKPVLYDFFKYIEKNAIKDFTKNAGGHPDRAGGSIGSLDNFECHKWVNNIISCDDFFQK